MTKPQKFGKRSIRPLALAGALLASASLGSMAWAQAAPDAPVSPAQRVLSDTWITTKVKSEILANSMSKAFEVGVTTENGVVLLKGKLPDQDAIDLVKMIAEKVEGVKSVDIAGLSIGP